jgi:ketosteroid isomerase-like protein
LAGVVAGARSPEELETLFEDAFVMRDPDELSALYDDGAVLVAGPGGSEARGGEAIGHAVEALWDTDRTYVAGPRRVLQARDTALLVADAGVHVLRRTADGAWRVAISLLDLDSSINNEEGT